MLSGDGCNSMIYSTKSGAKRLFALAYLNVPYGIHDIYSTTDIFSSLGNLILQYLHINRWILKIDQSNSGDGIAYIDLDKLKILRTLRREKDKGTEIDDNYWNIEEIRVNSKLI